MEWHAVPFMGRRVHSYSYEEKEMVTISVIKSKRTSSSVQFVDTAIKLQIHTIKQCVKFPKKYTFYISQDIANIANSICDHAKEANSINPTNLHEVQMRRDHLLNAYSKTQALISKINNAQEFFPISGGVMTEWMELIETELKTLRGIMKADRQRYKRFYQEDEVPVNTESNNLQ